MTHWLDAIVFVVPVESAVPFSTPSLVKANASAGMIFIIWLA
jgi:hypothetical protein